MRRKCEFGGLTPIIPLAGPVPLGAVALIIGPHQLAALFGLVLSVLFFRCFAGMLVVFMTAQS